MNGPRVGVVGLGAMGLPVARAVVRAGFEVTGFDLQAARVEHARRDGVRSARSVRDVANRSDVIITLLPSDAALDAVAQGEDGLRVGGRSELVVVEASTLSIAAKERARIGLAEMGIDVLDAPLSGTSHQARIGDLVVYASGERAVLDRITPVLAAFTRETYYMGAFGNGSRTKLVANLLVAVHNVAAAEALLLGRRAGLDLASLLDALVAGAGTSRMLEHRGPMMVSGDYADASMRVDLFGKDLRLIEQLAGDVGAPVPLLTVASRLYARALTEGLGELDTAAILSVLEREPVRDGGGQPPSGSSSAAQEGIRPSR